MSTVQMNNSLVFILIISMICSLLLAFASTILSINDFKFGIDRIFTSMPHLLLLNMAIIILISDSEYDLITTLFSIPFGTMNSVLFIFIYCLLSSLILDSMNNHFIYHLIITIISFTLWLLFSFILFAIIDYITLKHSHFVLFNIKFPIIIIMGIICALIQLLVASSIILAFTHKLSMIQSYQTQNDKNINSYVIRAIFSIIINILCIIILTANKYSILCGIICVFPSLHLSLNHDKPLKHTVIIFLLESSSLNIFALLVARFYSSSDIGIICSLLAAYVIVIVLFVIPIHFCLRHHTLKNKQVNPTNFMNSNEKISMYGSTWNDQHSEYLADQYSRAMSLGDL